MPLFDACMKMHAVSNAVVVNIVGQKCIRVCLDIVFCDAGVYMWSDLDLVPFNIKALTKIWQK